MTGSYLGYRVEVDINDAVEVAHHHARHLLQLLEVERARRLVDVARQRDGGEVTDGHLVLAAVLNDLGTQVAALDGAQVLLVALAVAGVLVEHVGHARLYLRLDDAVPQLLRLDRLATSTFSLVPVIQR